MTRSQAAESPWVWRAWFPRSVVSLAVVSTASYSVAVRSRSGVSLRRNSRQRWPTGVFWVGVVVQAQPPITNMSAVTSPASTSSSTIVITTRAWESPMTATCGTPFFLSPNRHGRSGSPSSGALHLAYCG